MVVLSVSVSVKSIHKCPYNGNIPKVEKVVGAKVWYYISHSDGTDETCVLPYPPPERLARVAAASFYVGSPGSRM